MTSVVDAWAEEELRSLSARSLTRTLEPLESRFGARVQFDGRWLINFSSNDYLGLTGDPELVRRSQEAVERWGAGSGASRLTTGDSAAHHSLERALATFHGAPSALLFNSGYAANTGTLPALVGPGDVVFSDALNHASIVDGCRLSRATVVVFPHRELAALERLLTEYSGRRRLVVTESVFSMDGDVAPLVAMSALCRAHAAGLYVDEAHGTGVFGATGRGVCDALGVEPDVHVGTLSKSFGGFGGYVIGSEAMRQLLVARARALVFSTALPPAWCEVMEHAVGLVQQASRRERLWARIRQLDPTAPSAIIPITLGSAEAALHAAAVLRDRGLVVKAIRPPTVPEGTSRLRISISAAHSESDIDSLKDGLRALGVDALAA